MLCCITSSHFIIPSGIYTHTNVQEQQTCAHDSILLPRSLLLALSIRAPHLSQAQEKKAQIPLCKTLSGAYTESNPACVSACVFVRVVQSNCSVVNNSVSIENWRREKKKS
jgi:hypothetical protein